eukprot:8177670-Pyramimonas_sp.AAC.1
MFGFDWKRNAAINNGRVCKGGTTLNETAHSSCAHSKRDAAMQGCRRKRDAAINGFRPKRDTSIDGFDSGRDTTTYYDGCVWKRDAAINSG